MIDPQWATFGVLAVALILFVTEWVAIDLVALLIPVVLGILGVLTPSEAFSGFGNGAVITVAGMFVISRALVDSGAVSVLGGFLQRLTAHGKRGVLPALVLLVAFPSAILNNTPVVAVFIPVVLALAEDRGIAPSKLLMPVSFAAILGGTLTVVGTSTTVLVSSEVERMRPGSGLSFFEPLPFGLVIVAVGIVYLLLVGPKLLPLRRTVTSMGSERPMEYVTEVAISEGSPIEGKSIREAFLDPHPGLVVIEIVRGEEILWPGTDGLALEVGDLVLVRGRAESVMRVGGDGENLLPELGGRDVRRRDVTLAELVIPRGSPVEGRSVRVATQRALQGAHVMAVQRLGSHLRSGIADLILREGDTLLVQTEAAHLPRFRDSEDFVLLEGLHEQRAFRKKAPIVLGITLAVVILAALDLVGISFLALGAAAALVITGCITMRRAYRALDLSTLALMAGTVSLGVAMEKSGAAELLVDSALGLTQGFESVEAKRIAALAACWLVTNVLTCLISNTAAAVVMLPLALDAASKLDVSSRPFVMVVVYAASIALATPMGYQTNLLVLGPGGYRFSDFARLGLPLQVLYFIVGVALLPLFFPF
jgi:di/tricarboxylate transporter